MFESSLRNAFCVLLFIKPRFIRGFSRCRHWIFAKYANNSSNIFVTLFGRVCIIMYFYTHKLKNGEA